MRGKFHPVKIVALTLAVLQIFFLAPAHAREKGSGSGLRPAQLAELRERIANGTTRDQDIDDALKQVRISMEAVHQEMLSARRAGDLERSLCLASRLARGIRYYQVMEESAGQLWSLAPSELADASIQLNRLSVAWSNAQDGLEADQVCGIDFSEDATVSVVVETTHSLPATERVMAKGALPETRSGLLPMPGLARQTMGADYPERED